MAWLISVDGSGATFRGVLAVADRPVTTTPQSSRAPQEPCGFHLGHLQEPWPLSNHLPQKPFPSLLPFLLMSPQMQLSLFSGQRKW